MNLSEHITEKEATHSATAVRLGIVNTPSAIEWENMKLVANKIFEPLRNHFNVPIGISSFYRSELLNKKIGGSKTSQHCKGEAIDIDADIYGGITNLQIFRYIKDNLEFDQLIWEYCDDAGMPQWVHVSYKCNNNRKEILKSSKNDKGKTIYLKFMGLMKTSDINNVI